MMTYKEYKEYKEYDEYVYSAYLVYQTFQSRGYCSNEVMIPWKLVSLSNSVILSQAPSVSHPVHGLSI